MYISSEMKIIKLVLLDYSKRTQASSFTISFHHHNLSFEIDDSIYCILLVFY